MQDMHDKLRPRTWLSLLGSSSIGKTHLAKKCQAYVRKEFVSWKTSAQLHYWPDVCAEMRGGNYKQLDELAKVPLLILAEIGADFASGFTNKSLASLLECRLNKWTMITANLGFNEIRDDLDARVASRMLRNDSRIVQMREVPDYELTQRQKKK